jgi:hypothetical protein
VSASGEQAHAAQNERRHVDAVEQNEERRHPRGNVGAIHS